MSTILLLTANVANAASAPILARWRNFRNEAQQRGIKGRSSMNKAQLQAALGAKAPLKGSRFKTLTCDQGSELQFFKDKLFVRHAYRADERGSCENVNRRLQELFPRGVAMDSYTDEYVAEVKDFINHRPRKILNGTTPYEIHFAAPRSPTVRT